MKTHYIPFFTRTDGRVQRAVCGALIHAVDHTAEPSCDDCRRWLEADVAEAATFDSVEDQVTALFGEPTNEPPVFARDPNFKSCDSYAVRKPKSLR